MPAKGVYVDGGAADADAPAQGQSDKDRYEETIPFPVGEPNPFGQFFVGQSYLAPLSTEQVPLSNVTFEPGCRNNWHVHCAEAGGRQMLVCVGGRGFYQEWGEDPVEMTPGSVVNIPAGVKHWHGAAPDSWFSHLAIEVPGQGAGTEWLEPVSDEDYGKLAWQSNCPCTLRTGNGSGCEGCSGKKRLFP